MMLGGLVWYPEVDFWKVYIQPTHFGKKKRGRYPDNLDTFDGRMMKMEDFVKKDLTRRDCTSVVAQVFDPTWRLAPLTGKLKRDLRRLIKVNPDWDKSLSEVLRKEWCDNFHRIESVSEIEFMRSPIPVRVEED